MHKNPIAIPSEAPFDDLKAVNAIHRSYAAAVKFREPADPLEHQKVPRKFLSTIF